MLPLVRLTDDGRRDSNRPTEAGLIADAEAAYAFAAARYPAERIVLWGESLGSGVAVASGRTAVSAVAERDESVTICNERMKASNTIAQCAAIAVKIQYDRLFFARRYVPDDHPLAPSLVASAISWASGRPAMAGGAEQRHGSSIAWGPVPTDSKRWDFFDRVVEPATRETRLRCLGRVLHWVGWPTFAGDGFSQASTCSSWHTRCALTAGH